MPEREKIVGLGELVSKIIKRGKEIDLDKLEVN